MKTVSNDKLKHVIETQHGGTAAYRQSVRVLSGIARADEWDGWVHIFDLRNNRNAQSAFAWSAPIKGGTEPRYFAVLRSATVSNPVQAVKAAAALINSPRR